MTFAEFSTFFLIVAVVAFPLHLAHGYAFRNVIEVSELHDQIASFPEDRTVRDVGPSRLTTYRTTYLLLNALELVLLALMVRAVRRALDDHLAGRVPTVSSSWRGIARGPGGYLRSLGNLGPLGGALVIAVILGVLAERVGLLIAQPLGDANAWLGLGTAQAVARSVGAPFLLVTWALLARDGGSYQDDPLVSRNLRGGDGEGDSS